MERARRRPEGDPITAWRGRRGTVPVALLVAAGCLWAAAAGTGQTTAGADWPSYGANSGSTKYSPLDRIDASNAARLSVAWTWTSPDLEIASARPGLRPLGLASTPLKIGERLYLTTSFSQIAAIDARSGRTEWVHDPKSYESGRPTNLGFVHRGLAYWTDGQHERLFAGTGDAYLLAIDARTGRPVDEFGAGGRVDLAAGVPRAVNAVNYAVSSPPIVVRDVVVVGASINDVPNRMSAPRGDVQGFDAKTGRRLWAFHTVPQPGEIGHDTWRDGSWEYTGNTNVWTMMSADEELGYVYLPIGTPTNDWYGGHRLGDNLFAESLVCLDARTGRRVWHFQTVHHGLWDYDLPAAPVLCDLAVDGRLVKAVAQVTKTGFCFVFDRRTGEPVWPIEERPVPRSAVPGERSSPTQPFPTRPPPFERQGATDDDLIDFTPELRREARAILDQYDHGPLFTPPSIRGTVNVPGWAGGANWWGAGFDHDSGRLFVPSITAPIVVRLSEPDGARSDFRFVRDMAGVGSAVSNLEGPRGLPLFKPPYGRITAIDLNDGTIAWQVPHGDGPRRAVNLIVGDGRDVGPLGAGGGGPLVTKTLLFVAQGAGGRGGARRDATATLRAFDKSTGRVVAEVALPGEPHGTPMTYLAGGRQYVALTLTSGRLVALSIPP